MELLTQIFFFFFNTYNKHLQEKRLQTISMPFELEYNARNPSIVLKQLAQSI